MWESSLMKKSSVKRKLNHLYKGSFSGSSFSAWWLHCFFPTSDLIWYMCACFCQDGFQHRGCGRFDNTYYGMTSLPFLTPEEPSCACAVREVFLTSGVKAVFILPNYSSRAHLLLLTLFLVWNKAPIYSTWQGPAAQCWGPTTSYLTLTLKKILKK